MKHAETLAEVTAALAVGLWIHVKNPDTSDPTSGNPFIVAGMNFAGQSAPSLLRLCGALTPPTKRRSQSAGKFTDWFDLLNNVKRVIFEFLSSFSNET